MVLQLKLRRPEQEIAHEYLWSQKQKNYTAEPGTTANGVACHGSCSEQHAPRQATPSLSFNVGGQTHTNNSMNTKPTQWRIAVLILSALTVVSCSNQSSTRTPTACLGPSTSDSPAASSAAPTKAEVAKEVVAGVAASWGPPGAYVFEVDSLRVEGDWAFVLYTPKANQGDGQFFALLRKVGGSWKVLETEGASDGGLVESCLPKWKKKYPKAPDKLFNA
jgi:hypothetical protein